MVDLPSRGGVTGNWISPFELKASYIGTSGGIIRGSGADWFGPLDPINPMAPPEVAGRQFDYLSGYNLGLAPRQYEPIGFPTLRAIADSYDVLRLVIETRKDQIGRMKWNIKARDKKQQKSLAGKIKIASDFLERPDRVNAWPDWVRMILEDVFVIDALSLYQQRTRGGKLYALEPMDGACIAPKIDDWGRTPRPYNGPDGKLIIPVAYQQILKGLPAVNYSVRDMIYRPRNKRTSRAYGFGPVEQIVTTVNIALRRNLFLLNYYTEGNMPDVLIGTPATWTPDQIKAYQKHFDAMFAGNLANRRKAKFVPGDGAKNVYQTKEPELKGEFDEWLARLTCYAFSVSPQAFVKMMNRATASTAQETAEEEGLVPILNWLATLMSDLLAAEFDGADLEFAWQQDETVDEAQQQTILSGYVGSGLMTINQGRAKLGLDPDPSPAADILMVKTASGVVPIEALTLEGKKAALDALGPPMPQQIGGDTSEGGQGGSEDGKGGAGGKTTPGNAKPGGGAREASGAPKGGKKTKAGADATSKTVADVAELLVETGVVAADDPELMKRAEAAVEQLAAVFSTAEVGKRAATPFRRLEPIAYPRPATRRVVRKMRGLWESIFARQARAAAFAIRATLSKLAKDDDGTDEEIAKVIDALDLSLDESQRRDLEDALSTVAADASSGAFAQVSVGTTGKDDIFEQLDQASLGWATEHAAELVTQIDETTRGAVRQAIADGIQSQLSVPEIADSIADLGAFSDERALLIAQNEIATANSQGSLAGYKQARETGVVVKKAWLLGPDPCEACQENADAGAIDLDDQFPSGDDAPTAHPRCECALSPVVEDDNSGDEEAGKLAKRSRFLCDAA